MTKPITSIAFMMLVERARSRVDTPVHHVLPEFKGLGVYDGGGGGRAVPRPGRPPSRCGWSICCATPPGSPTASRTARTSTPPIAKRKIENWHGNLDLDGFVAALGKLPLEFSPGDGVELFGLDRRARRGRAARLGHAARPNSSPSASSRRSGWTTPSSTVPADKIDRLTDCYTLRARQGPRDVRSRRDERLEPDAASCVRAAAGWSRPRSIITASAACA